MLSLTAMVFYATGEIFSKKYANTGLWKFGTLAFIAYALVCLLWLPTLRIKNSLAIMRTIWDVLYAITGIMIGIMVFKEQLNNYNYLGLIFAIIAVVLLCK